MRIWASWEPKDPEATEFLTMVSRRSSFFVRTSRLFSRVWYSRDRSRDTALILVSKDATMVSMALTAASRFLENPGSRLAMTSRDGKTCRSMMVLLLAHSRPQRALSFCQSISSNSFRSCSCSRAVCSSIVIFLRSWPRVDSSSAIRTSWLLAVRVRCWCVLWKESYCDLVLRCPTRSFSRSSASLRLSRAWDSSRESRCLMMRSFSTSAALLVSRSRTVFSSSRWSLAMDWD